ncbi:mammalian uncoordinated homology 13 protein [Tanacetum coccineum]
MLRADLFLRFFVRSIGVTAIEPFLKDLEQNFMVIADTVNEMVRTRLVAEIMKASFEGFLLVLLAGLDKLKMTSNLSEIYSGLTVMETIIERFRRVTLETYGSSAKSRLLLLAITGQWSPSDPNTLLRNGQALSTRPYILPSVYCTELAKLQDQIPPFSTKVAICSIETQLGAPVSQLFADISPEPMAAASLGHKVLQLICIQGASSCKSAKAWSGICLKKSITSLTDKIVSGLLLYMVSVTDFEESKLKDYVEMTKDFVKELEDTTSSLP